MASSKSGEALVGDLEPQSSVAEFDTLQTALEESMALTATESNRRQPKQAIRDQTLRNFEAFLVGDKGHDKNRDFAGLRRIAEEDGNAIN